MIVFDLRCANDHVFEAWFGSSEDYAAQAARGLVECPMCASREVEKAVMAPAVGAKGNRAPTPAEREVAKRKAALRELAAMQARLEENCDYVGRNFAAEARARHDRGELQTSARGLMGEATLADAVALIDDGIAVQPLPFRPRRAADA